MNRQWKHDERGYALVVFLVILGIGLFVLANSLGLATTSIRTNYATKKRSDEFFATDNSMNLTVNWFRSQNLNMISPFTRGNFYSTFTKGSPSVGANDVPAFNIPTKIKISGGNNSVILTAGGTGLGTATFPATQNLNSGATYNAVTGFQSGSFGTNLVRATLVDAVPADPSQDFGAPPAAAPQTDFYPIYRLDSLKATDSGTHLLGYLIGSLTYYDTIGFYGRDLVEMRQDCDSYISANGPYGNGNKRAHCPVGSNSTIQIHQNTELYGSARTNGGFNEGSPFGGQVCADLSCSSQGTKCSGNTCNVPGLPTFSPWATYCPTNQGALNVNSNSSLTVGGPNANQKCWSTVTIANNKTLTLTSSGPNNAYFFNNLVLPNNGTLKIAPSAAGGIVYLYIYSFNGIVDPNANNNNINGNQLLNTNNRPSQLKMYYLGPAPLKLNGTAAINMALVSPYAGVEISGNFTYSGGAIAKSLVFTGSGAIHYDESLGGQTLTGMTYRLRDKVEYYN